MNEGPGAGRLLKRSVATRWTLLGVGLLWALGVAAFIFGYHIDEPHGVLTITVGGHTYAGNPPALTLYEKDGGVWILALFMIIGVVLLLGALDLVIRTSSHSTRSGILAILAGGFLVLYSLFGLIPGLLGIGTIGVLVILVGLPMKARKSEVEVDSAAPAGWYPGADDEGLLRWWDGSQWTELRQPPSRRSGSVSESTQEQLRNRDG